MWNDSKIYGDGIQPPVADPGASHSLHPLSVGVLFPFYRRPRHHLVAQAQNGSGKTVCFALGSLAYVNEAIPAPQVLVIAHVRELILQIGEVFTHLCRGVGFRSSQASTHPSSARTS